MIEIKNFGALDDVAKKALVTVFCKDAKIFFWDKGKKYGDVISNFHIIKHFSSVRHGRRFRWEVLDNEIFARGSYGCLYRSLFTLSINEKGELEVKTRKPGSLRLIKAQTLDKRDSYHLGRMLVECDAMEYSAILEGKPLVKVDDVIYMIMRELPGRPLRELVIENKLTVKERYNLSKALVQALDTQIHKRGYVHRDLSYNNVLVWRQNGEFKVYIIDFGFIKIKDYDDSAEQVGTPDFMGPECFEAKITSMQSDIYSLGCIFRYLWGGIDNKELDAYKKALTPPFSYTFYRMHEVPSCYLKIQKMIVNMCHKHMEKRPDLQTILADLNQLDGQFNTITKPINTLFTPASLIPGRCTPQMVKP